MGLPAQRNNQTSRPIVAMSKATNQAFMNVMRSVTDADGGVQIVASAKTAWLAGG